MAKGKHANSANAKKLRAAEERIRELEDLRARESQEAHEREEALKAEIQHLKGRLVTEVDDEVERRTHAFQQQHEQRVGDLQSHHRKRLRDALSYITEHGKFELTLEGYGEFANRLGIQVGDIMDWTTKGNRNSRRARKAHHNKVVETERQGRL